MYTGHSIPVKRRDGSFVNLHIAPLTLNEVLRNNALIQFLHNRKIFTTEDFLGKIKNKDEILKITGNKKFIPILQNLYLSLVEGFVMPSYGKKVSGLLKRLHDLNMRLTNSDRSIIGTCIIFKKIISDKWKFLKKYLSDKLRRRISAQENVWQKTFLTYIS